MGPFHRGLLATFLLSASIVGQDVNPLQPAPVGDPAAAPGLPASVAPEIDPNLPAQIPIDPPHAEPVPAAPQRKSGPKKVAAPAIPMVRGKVAKLDKLAMTLSVDVKGKSELFQVTSKTRIFADGKPAIFADGKVGEQATVEFRAPKGKTREALAIRFGAAPAPKPAAKPAKKSPPAAKKPAPAIEQAPSAVAPDPVYLDPNTIPTNLPAVPQP